MTRGWCEHCLELVPIRENGMRAGRQRRWYPLRHRTASGEECPGSVMEIQDHKEPTCCK